MAQDVWHMYQFMAPVKPEHSCIDDLESVTGTKTCLIRLMTGQTHKWSKSM